MTVAELETVKPSTPWASIRRAILGAADQPLFPVLTLFVLVLLAYADATATGVLGPNIKATFRYSNLAFGAIAGAGSALAVMGALPLGYLGDRLRRVDLVVVMAVILGAATVASALAWNLPLFAWVIPGGLVYAVARIATGIGEISNGPIQQSLLADYYPQSVRPRAFALQRAGYPLGIVAGALLGGFVASHSNWRYGVVIFGLPAFAVALLAGLLREPARGAHEGVTLDAELPKLSAAMRRLWGIVTLRRIWIGALISGAGYFPLLTFSSLFYSDVYRVGDFQRGVITAVGGALLFLGLATGGVMAQRLHRHTVKGQVFYAGASVVVAAVCVLFGALSHPLALAAGGLLLSNFFGGMYFPALTQVQGLVAPPRIRATAYAGAYLFFGLGGFVGSVLAGGMGDKYGLRVAVGVLAVPLGIGGAVIAAAYVRAHEDAVSAARQLAVQLPMLASGPEGGDAPLVQLVGIDFSYEGTQVLFGASLEVRENERLALLGTNGAGKSTLLRVLAGMLTPSAGAVLYRGQDVTAHTPEDLARGGIILVPGGRAVFQGLTVRENLELATWLYRRERRTGRGVVAEAVDRFPTLGRRLDQPAAVLSGGERQMLAIAQGLICRPHLLLIDELTLGLSPVVVEELMGVVKRLTDEGITLVLVEQSLNIASLLCERAYFMEKGAVRYEGPPAALLERPDLARAVFLGGRAG